MKYNSKTWQPYEEYGPCTTADFDQRFMNPVTRVVTHGEYINRKFRIDRFGLSIYIRFFQYPGDNLELVNISISKRYHIPGISNIFSRMAERKMTKFWIFLSGLFNIYVYDDAILNKDEVFKKYGYKLN